MELNRDDTYKLILLHTCEGLTERLSIINEREPHEKDKFHINFKVVH